MIATPKQILLVSRMASQTVQSVGSESIHCCSAWFLQLEYLVVISLSSYKLHHQMHLAAAQVSKNRRPETCSYPERGGPEPVAEGTRQTVQLYAKGHQSARASFSLCISWPCGKRGTVNPILSSGETSTGSTPTSAKRQPRHCHSCRHGRVERVHQRGSEQRTKIGSSATEFFKC
jgi:hypothetical protein